jgi:integrase
MLRQLEPHFGKLLLNDRASWVIAVDQYRTQKARLNRKTVANHLTLLGSILRVAHELGWMEQLPVIRKPRVRLHSTDYSYLRTAEEEARFLRAAAPEGRMVYVLYLTAISTGLRAGELAGLQWADVDFGTRLITVQRSFEQPTKSDDVRYVPILDSLLPELRRWRLEQPGRLVFTNQNGTMLGKCARAYQEVLRRVLDRANFPRIQRGGKERRYIHFHDLRHTFASRWVMKGGDLFKLQKILGHKSMAMTLRYAHLQPSAFAEDYGRFGARDPAQSGLVVELPVARQARNHP